MDSLLVDLVTSPSVVAAPAAASRPPPISPAHQQSASRPPTAPWSTTSTMSSLGGVAHGLLSGKAPLFYFDDRTRTALCAGYIGGKSGLKQRFCCKPIEGGVGNARMFCCNGHKGAKFPLTPRTYYVPMKNDSALVSPFVTAAELESEDSLHLAAEEHSSREWIDLITEFTTSHGYCSLPAGQATFGFTEDQETGGEETGDGSDDVFLLP
jgi:hypothetical protein